jgi:hypothetical protein
MQIESLKNLLALESLGVDKKSRLRFFQPVKK